MSKPLLEISQHELRRQTRRSFLIGGTAAVAGLAGYSWMQLHREPSGIPLAERRVLDVNGEIWHNYLSQHHRMPAYPVTRIENIKANGAVGLDDPVPDDWDLSVVTNAGPVLSLTM